MQWPNLILFTNLPILYSNIVLNVGRVNNGGDWLFSELDIMKWTLQQTPCISRKYCWKIQFTRSKNNSLSTMQNCQCECEWKGCCSECAVSRSSIAVCCVTEDNINICKLLLYGNPLRGQQQMWQTASVTTPSAQHQRQQGKSQAVKS